MAEPPKFYGFSIQGSHVQAERPYGEGQKIFVRETQGGPVKALLPMENFSPITGAWLAFKFSREPAKPTLAQLKTIADAFWQQGIVVEMTETGPEHQTPHPDFELCYAKVIQGINEPKDLARIAAAINEVERQMPPQRPEITR
jgi:hypothetical protein